MLLIFLNSVQKLKTGKSCQGLFCDHIIHGPHLLFVLLANIINFMLVHGISPESMIIGTMVPIPKCKRKMMRCSDNYRAITVSSLVGKVLDWVILLKEQTALRWPASVLSHSWMTWQDILAWSPFCATHPLDIYSNNPCMTAHICL